MSDCGRFHFQLYNSVKYSEVNKNKMSYFPLKIMRRSFGVKSTNMLVVCYNDPRKLVFSNSIFHSLPPSSPSSLALIIYTKKQLSCKQFFPAHKRPLQDLPVRWTHLLLSCSFHFPVEELFLWYHQDSV